MAKNTQGLRRGGPGRPKGSKNHVPKKFKKALENAFLVIGHENPELVKAAIEKGLRGQPREAFPFVQLFSFYNHGKPPDVIDLRGGVMPKIINNFTTSAPPTAKS